jgi:opacity protein-like surface antigen
LTYLAKEAIFVPSVEKKRHRRGRDMKRLILPGIVLFSLLGFGPAAAESEGPSLSLKLSGGAAFLLNGAGDLERLRAGRMRFIEDHRFENSYATTFNWDRLSLVPDFNVELIFNITPRFGIGIGSGIVKAASEGRYSLEDTISYDNSVYVGSETTTDSTTRDYGIRAIPVTLDIYYFNPLGDSRKFGFFVYGGVGYYFGKLTHDYQNTYVHRRAIQWVDDEYEFMLHQFADTIKEESTRNGVGFRAGLGLEMAVTPFLSLGLEAFGRYVNFSGWEGDHSEAWVESIEWANATDELEITQGTSRESGTLWFYESRHNDKDYADMWIREIKPEGEGISGVKRAAINLNALGLQLSLRFHFDL